MLTANRDYFCTYNCYIIVLRHSCQIILPRTYITAVNDGVLRALIDKQSPNLGALFFLKVTKEVARHQDQASRSRPVLNQQSHHELEQPPQI